ncbi:MAG: murein biosynthesis integral membrane protein MurJ [Actinomycetales bacterium]
MANRIWPVPAPAPRGRRFRPQAEAQTSSTRSSAGMAAGTLISRLLGLIKGVLFGVAVISGNSAVGDIFDTSNNLPNIIYLLVAGGVFNAVLIPQIIKASGQPDRGADFISRLLTLAVGLLLAATLILTLLAGPLMNLLTDFTDSQLVIATAFALFLLPQIFFYGLYSLLGQVLNAHGSFVAYAWAPIVNNVVAIGGLLLFIWTFGTGKAFPRTVDNWTVGQTWLLAGSATLGIVIQSFVLLWPLKRLGLGLRPRFGWRGMGFKATGKIAAWTMGTMVVGNLSFLVIGWVATSATGAKPDGTVGGGADIAGPYVLSRATELYILPHSVIALSIATVLFTRMSAAAAAGERAAVRAHLASGLRTMGVATIFGAAALLVLAGPLGMIYSGGVQSTGRHVAITLGILAVGAPFLSANFMMNRVFYASENARTPFLIQILLVIFGVGTAVLAALLPAGWIIYGLATTYTAGNILAVLVTHLFLRSRIGPYGVGQVFMAHVRFLVAALGAALAGDAVLLVFGGFSSQGFAWSSIPAALAVIAVVGPVMALAYFAVLRLMRVRELAALTDPLLGALRGRIPGFR